MEETKRCPYCGEEILAVAKKCKHCGEWLEEDDFPDQEPLALNENEDVEIAETDDEALFSHNIPLSNAAIRWAFWAALIGLIIVTAHGLIPDGETLSTSIGSGKSRSQFLCYNSRMDWTSFGDSWCGGVTVIIEKSLLKNERKLWWFI